MSILMQTIAAFIYLIFMTLHKAELFSYIILFNFYSNCMSPLIDEDTEDKKNYSACPRIH